MIKSWQMAKWVANLWFLDFDEILGLKKYIKNAAQCFKIRKQWSSSGRSCSIFKAVANCIKTRELHLFSSIFFLKINIQCFIFIYCLLRSSYHPLLLGVSAVLFSSLRIATIELVLNPRWGDSYFDVLFG